jgi:hypothetical protein
MLEWDDRLHQFIDWLDAHPREILFGGVCGLFIGWWL